MVILEMNTGTLSLVYESYYLIRMKLSLTLIEKWDKTFVFRLWENECGIVVPETLVTSLWIRKNKIKDGLWFREFINPLTL